MTIWKYKRQQICVSWPHTGMWIISVSTVLSVFLMCKVCPWIAFHFTQTAVNHRRVRVLFIRRCGRAGGNCELIAISFIPLYYCQCSRGADGTDGDVILLLLFMLGSHMVSIPADMAEICMPDMHAVNENWGLQQNKIQSRPFTQLLLSLMLY